jgi:hypothetical protein
MYQPKIRDELISRLYHLAKALDMPMTRLVNTLLEHGIARLEAGAENVHETPGRGYRASKRRQRRS